MVPMPAGFCQLCEYRFQLSCFFHVPGSHHAAGRNPKEEHGSSHWDFYQRQRTSVWSFICLGTYARGTDLWPPSEYKRQFVGMICFLCLDFVFSSISQLFNDEKHLTTLDLDSIDTCYVTYFVSDNALVTLKVLSHLICIIFWIIYVYIFPFLNDWFKALSSFLCCGSPVYREIHQNF